MPLSTIIVVSELLEITMASLKMCCDGFFGISDLTLDKQILLVPKTAGTVSRKYENDTLSKFH